MKVKYNMLTKQEVRYLKPFAHKTEALYQIGKNELGQSQIDLLRKGLAAREMIKIHLLTTVSETPKEVAEKLVSLLDATLVEIKGRNITIFRQKSKDSAFKLPK